MIARPWAIALLCAIALLPAASAGASVVYTDSTFSDSDWSTTYQFTGTLGTPPTAAQQSTGGHTGAWERIDLLNFSNILFTYHALAGATYTPSLDGAIDSIDWQQDVLALVNRSGINIALAPCIRQGGKDYYSNNSVFNNSTTTWLTAGLGALQASDFRTFVSSTQHPDFGATGGLMQLGFVASSNNGGVTASRAAGIDNFSITVNSVTPATPAPEPSGLAIAGGGVLLALRRRRALLA